MSIININNSMISDILGTIKRADTSKYDMYMSVLRATTIIASEAAKDMKYHDIQVGTVFGSSRSQGLYENLRIITHLRSGLPMSEALRVFFKCGNISYIVLDKTITPNILYSSVGYIKKFENVIICEPFLVDKTSVEMIIEHLLSKGATPKIVFVLSLVATREAIELIDKEYPEVTFYVGCEDDYFRNYFNNDKNMDCIGAVMFGDHKEVNNLKINKFYN